MKAIQTAEKVEQEKAIKVRRKRNNIEKFPQKGL